MSELLTPSTKRRSFLPKPIPKQGSSDSRLQIDAVFAYKSRTERFTMEAIVQGGNNFTMVRKAVL